MNDTEQDRLIQLLDALRSLDTQKHSEVWKIMNKVFADRTDEEIISVMFKCKDKNISLTNIGVKVLKSYYDHWEIKLNAPLTSRQHLLLARACNFPYYIGDTHLIIFEPEIGTMLKVAEGNNKFIENMFG